MNKYFLNTVSVLALAASVVAATRDVIVDAPEYDRTAPTKAFGPSRVETKLNVEVKDGTQAVHFIKDNNDPRIVTKAYLVKNADAFILRGVLKKAISSSVTGNAVGVESLTYVDGSSVILVSADEYLFQNTGNGQTMDQLFESLDKKNLPNSSGTIDMAYFPKYNSARILLDMLQNSGMGFSGAIANNSSDLVSSSQYSNAFTYDDKGRHVNPFGYMVSDDPMNALVMTAPGYDMDEALRFLEAVDTPAGEIHLTYKLVELYSENDQKLGLDFQAWKNNEGIDLFSVGGKYGTNWSSSGLTPNRGSTYSEYFNFNPKWNTRYVDFLTTCGKAKVVSSGTLTLANGFSTQLVLKDGLFAIENEDITTEKTTSGEKVVRTIKDGDKEIVVTEPTSETTKTKGKKLVDNLPDGNALHDLIGIAEEALDHQVAEGKLQNVNEAANADIRDVSGNYFRLITSGGVHSNACDLSVEMLSFSVIGWQGNGKARTANSQYKTELQLGSKAKDFVIGGLTKSSVVRSVSGLPWLKDLPVIGWIFSTETDTVKKSQFVLIASAKAVYPADKLSADVQKDVKKINDVVGKAVKSPASTLGFQQLWIDKDK